MIDKPESHTILYRPVGMEELALIYDSGMKAFPARLPQQPIFYPVLQLEYARQIASDWNTKSGQVAGYVTQFKVQDQYIKQFEKHTVGTSQHQEFWIPAEELEEFNKHIVGHIRVVEAYFGDQFRGFIPDKFGLQAKEAVEQFTILANSYIYTRMDFYLEIRRNHKAIFLNYPFWQKHDFKNPGLKEKVLQAIKEACLKSFPQFSLPFPSPVSEDNLPAQKTAPPALDNPIQVDIQPVEQTNANPLSDSVEEEIPFEEEPDSNFPVNPVHQEIEPVQPSNLHILVASENEKTTLSEPINSHLVQGVELGLRRNYQEAVDELSKAVEEEPNHVVARTNLGVALHGLGKDSRALSSYEAALRIDPTYAEAHYFRANILYAQGNVREAITGYTLAIGLQPELIEAHQKPDPEDRLTDYTGSPAEMRWIAKPAHRILRLNQSLETNSQQGALFKERATQYYRLRNYVQAIADYSSYLAINPDDASALHFRGVAYEQIGQSERALEDYQRAIAIHPRLSDVYINRGVSFGKMRNFRQSVVSLTEGIRLAPKNPDGYFNRGNSYFQLGNFEAAIADFSKAIQLSPNDEDVYYWRGISNEEAGRQQAAIADYRQFLAISQNSQAKAEIEQKLLRWNEAGRKSLENQNAISDDQTIKQVPADELNQDLDLYDLILALSERALASTWFGSGVDCYGENADKLYAFTNHDQPIEGQKLLDITSGIYQTIEGDFQAFDPGGTSPWIFIRAWDGNGFYIETNDPEIKERLQSHLQAIQEVEGASPPYESLFLPV